jgi:hypothetical protein
MKPIGSFSAAIDATTVGQDPAPCSSARVGTLFRESIRSTRGKIAGAAAVLPKHEQRGGLKIPARYVSHARSIAQ